LTEAWSAMRPIGDARERRVTPTANPPYLTRKKTKPIAIRRSALLPVIAGFRSLNAPVPGG